MDKTVIDKAIDQALAESHEQGIHGKETTPFLLARVAELSPAATASRATSSSCSPTPASQLRPLSPSLQMKGGAWLVHSPCPC